MVLLWLLSGGARGGDARAHRTHDTGPNLARCCFVLLWDLPEHVCCIRACGVQTLTDRVSKQLNSDLPMCVALVCLRPGFCSLMLLVTWCALRRLIERSLSASLVAPLTRSVVRSTATPTDRAVAAPVLIRCVCLGVQTGTLVPALARSLGRAPALAMLCAMVRMPRVSLKAWDCSSCLRVVGFWLPRSVGRRASTARTAPTSATRLRRSTRQQVCSTLTLPINSVPSPIVIVVLLDLCSALQRVLRSLLWRLLRSSRAAARPAPVHRQWRGRSLCWRCGWGRDLLFCCVGWQVECGRCSGAGSGRCCEIGRKRQAQAMMLSTSPIRLALLLLARAPSRLEAGAAAQVC